VRISGFSGARNLFRRNVDKRHLPESAAFSGGAAVRRRFLRIRYSADFNSARAESGPASHVRSVGFGSLGRTQREIILVRAEALEILGQRPESKDKKPRPAAMEVPPPFSAFSVCRLSRGLRPPTLFCVFRVFRGFQFGAG